MKSVCVFLGANPGNDIAYTHAAKELGREIASRNLRLVYGGSSVGLMAEVANAALREGGEVVGVIPQALRDKEIAHTGLTELHVVKDMHERKALMNRFSDGFIAMPGGFGTMEEIFEVVTWGQLGFHAKPCGLLEVNGYFDGLNQFLDHMVSQGFVKPAHRSMIISDKSPKVLLDRFAAYTPPSPKLGKWVQLEGK